MPARSPAAAAAAAAATPDFGEFVDDDALVAAMESGDTVPGEQLPLTDVNAATPAQYVPNTALLDQAHGSPAVWAGEFAKLISSITGAEFDEATLEGWLGAYGAQVSKANARSALFQIANFQLPAHVSGDPALAMLELRNDIAAGFRHQAGVR